MNPEDFKCTVCVTWLDDPRTLPCGHTYCINCILILSIDAKERRLKPACPLCRKTFEPTDGDVQQMPVNDAVRDGAARLKAAAQLGEDAELPMLEGLLDECPLHVGSLLEFYCPSCTENPFKCFECASEHAQSMPIHELISADEGKEKLIEEIEKLAGVVQDKKEKASKSLKEIQEKMDKVDTQCEGIEKEIDTKFDSYLSQIEKLEIASRKKLRDLYQESMQPLEQDEELCQQLKSDIQALIEKHSVSSEQDKPIIEQQLKQLISTSLAPLRKHRSVRVSIPETLRLDLDDPSPSSASLETQAQEWVSFADQHPPTPTITSIGEGIDLASNLPIPSSSSHIRLHAIPGESSFVIAQGTPVSLHRVDLTIESGKAKSLSTKAIPLRDPINTTHTCLSTTPHQLILATLLTKTPPQITKSQFITSDSSNVGDDGVQSSSEITADASGFLVNQSPCVDIAVDWAGDVYSAHTAPGSLHKYTPRSTNKDTLTTQWTVSDPDQTRVWCAMLCDGDRLLVLTHSALPPHQLTLLVWSLSGVLVQSLELSLGQNDSVESTESGDVPQRLALLLTGSRGFGVVHPKRGKVFFFARDGTPCGVVAKAGVVAAAFVGARLVVAREESGSLRVHAY